MKSKISFLLPIGLVLLMACNKDDMSNNGNHSLDGFVNGKYFPGSGLNGNSGGGGWGNRLNIRYLKDHNVSKKLWVMSQ